MEKTNEVVIEDQQKEETPTTKGSPETIVEEKTDLLEEINRVRALLENPNNMFNLAVKDFFSLLDRLEEESLFTGNAETVRAQVQTLDFGRRDMIEVLISARQEITAKEARERAERVEKLRKFFLKLAANAEDFVEIFS